MKKSLTFCVLLFSYVLVQAQNAPLLKQFAKNVKGINKIIKYNDKVAVLQIRNENDNFDVVAVNDQMQQLWRITLQGYAVALANFKGKILAVAATEYNTFKTNNNTFKGFIIDGTTGKVTAEKVMYDGQQDYFMQSFFFSSKTGAYFKMALRQTEFKRKVHVGLPGPLALVSINAIGDDLLATTELNVMDFDENLNVINTLKPALGDGYFAGIVCNDAGDVAVAWYSGASVKLARYTKGKPSGEITEDLDVGSGEDKNMSQKVNLFASGQNPTIFYTTLFAKNSNKQWVLEVTKYDFKTKAKSTTSVEYNKQTVKDIEKAYKTIDKKIDKPDFGPEKDFAVRGIAESKDRLLVAMTARYTNTDINNTIAGMHPTALIERSMLIAGFDRDLSLLYHQQFPSSCVNGLFYLNPGFDLTSGGLFRVASIYNNKKMIVGTLNIDSGEWEKMEVLNKDKIDADYGDAEHIIWFGQTYILPYHDLKGITKTNRDITLLLNNY